MPLLLLLVCAPAAAQTRSADSAAVVATVQRLFDALERRDTAAMRALVLHGVPFVAIRGDTVVTAPRVVSDTAFRRMLGARRDRPLERMWSPEVRVEGSLATLFAPHDFHVDGRWTHCGWETLTLVRVRTEWRVSAFTYTVQRRGCTPSPLGPPPEG